MCIDITESQCVWNRRGKTKRYRNLLNSVEALNYPITHCHRNHVIRLNYGISVFIFIFMISILLSCSIFPAISYDEGMLKWKSHDMTNANTMQASRKLRKRWPCQMLRVSPWPIAAEIEDVALALFTSFESSAVSISVAPATLRAIELQISQVL